MAEAGTREVLKGFVFGVQNCYFFLETELGAFLVPLEVLVLVEWPVRQLGCFLEVAWGQYIPARPLNIGTTTVHDMSAL